jgi:hypothetical protein
MSFVLSLLRCFKPELGRIVLPRLCLVGFNFAQPFLITAVLEQLYQPDDEQSRLRGYELIAATLFIYSGIAVSAPLSIQMHLLCLF